MKLGSLCSGAGGLDMAVEQVFGAETVWHCELEKLTDKKGKVRHNAAIDVLATRWPGVPNHGDLTTIDWTSVEPVDILTGGYPCQPFSAAGQRKGEDDERNLWPDVREAIRRVRPRITLLENVSGHRSLGFDRVLGDLAEDGMDVRWTSLRAADVGSCHGRERLWIMVTDPSGDGWPRVDGGSSGAAARGGWEREPTGGAGGAPVTELLATPQARDYKGVPSDGFNNANLCRDVALLQTPSVADALGGHLTRSGARGDEPLLPGQAREMASAWGKYEPAIRRWESLTRPAPPPTEPNTKGNPRLNPAFSEWMMGWPAGWVTDVPGISRNDQLRIIGNGVVPQCAAAALMWLLSLEVAA